jgi:uncharacterized protein (DUF1778 family)
MSTVPQDDRIDLRLPAEQKQLIEQAAEWLGQPVSSFILSLAIPKAVEVLHDRDVTILSIEERDRFLALLDQTDPEPNAAMRRAAERSQHIIE